MNEVVKCLKERRSIKKFKSEQITEAELTAILEAGMNAPSGVNMQSAVIVAVQDKATRDLLSKMNGDILGTNSDPFYGAPTVAVVLVDKTKATPIEDGCLVMGNMLNAAHAIGLGGCWIHRAKEMFESAEGKKLLEKWGLNENYVGVGNCVLGYADMKAEEKPRKDGYVIRV